MEFLSSSRLAFFNGDCISFFGKSWHMHHFFCFFRSTCSVFDYCVKSTCGVLDYFQLFVWGALWCAWLVWRVHALCSVVLLRELVVCSAILWICGYVLAYFVKSTWSAQLLYEKKLWCVQLFCEECTCDVLIFVRMIVKTVM